MIFGRENAQYIAHHTNQDKILFSFTWEMYLRFHIITAFCFGDVRIIDKKNVCLERCTNNRLLFKENTNFKGKLYCELRTRWIFKSALSTFNGDKQNEVLKVSKAWFLHITIHCKKIRYLCFHWQLNKQLQHLDFFKNKNLKGHLFFISNHKIWRGYHHLKVLKYVDA